MAVTLHKVPGEFYFKNSFPSYMTVGIMEKKRGRMFSKAKCVPKWVFHFFKRMPHHLWRINSTWKCALLIQWTTYVGALSVGKSPRQDQSFTEIRNPQGSSRGCSEFFQDAWKNLGIFGNFYSAQEEYKKVVFFFFFFFFWFWAHKKFGTLKNNNSKNFWPFFEFFLRPWNNKKIFFFFFFFFFFAFLPTKTWAPWKLLMLKSFGHWHCIIRFKRFSIYAQTFWA